MTTWSWECLLDGATGTAPSYDEAVAAAQAHNDASAHDAPEISYGNDDPPADLTAQYEAEAKRIQGLQLTASDWTMSPPPDLPADVLQEVTDARPDWSAWREAVRALDTSADPLVWPWPHPPRPPVYTIPEPPPYAQTAPVNPSPPSNPGLQTITAIDGTTQQLDAWSARVTADAGGWGNVTYSVPNLPLDQWATASIDYSVEKGGVLNAWLGIRFPDGNIARIALGSPPNYDQAAPIATTTLDLLGPDARIDLGDWSLGGGHTWADLVATVGGATPDRLRLNADGSDSYPTGGGQVIVIGNVTIA
jgi:hypothetical protein